MSLLQCVHADVHIKQNSRSALARELGLDCCVIIVQCFDLTKMLWDCNWYGYTDFWYKAESPESPPSKSSPSKSWLTLSSPQIPHHTSLLFCAIWWCATRHNTLFATNVNHWCRLCFDRNITHRRRSFQWWAPDLHCWQEMEIDHCLWVLSL